MKKFSIPSKFSLSDDFTLNNPDFHLVKLRIMSSGENYNGSSFTIDSLNKAKDSVAYTPILANIVEREDGELDANGHDVDFEMKADYKGNVSFKETYIERPVGVFLNNSTEIKYDEENDVNYIQAYGIIWKTYSSMYDILKRDEVKDVSVEIEVINGQFRDDGYYEIQEYNILATTILGNGNLPAIENSRIEFNFSQDNDYRSKLEQVDILLQNFNKKGGGKGMDENKELEQEFAEEEAVEIPVIVDEPQQEFAEEDEVEEDMACGNKKKKKCSAEDEEEVEEDMACGNKKKKRCAEDEEDVCPNCGKPMSECECDNEEDMACGNKKKKKCSEDEEEEMACNPKKKKKCSCEEEKLYSQAELDEAIANTKAEFSDALVELAELREFKAEYDRQVKIQQLNSEMDEIVANFNVNEDKVKELREKVLEGQYSMEKFELELYRNNQPIKNNFSKDDKKSTSLPIVDTEEKMSEVDLLFAKYGIPKNNK